jgi:hypothetical protein
MTTTPVRRPSRVLAAALAIVMSGCSFVSVNRVRQPADVSDPRVLDTCTASSDAAIGDTVLAGAGIIAGNAMLFAAAADASCSSTTTGSSTCKTGDPAPGLAVLAAAMLFTGSAVYGYITTAQCRRHVETGGLCATGDYYACQRLKPGWTPPPGWRAGPTLDPRPVPAALPAAQTPPPAVQPVPPAVQAPPPAAQTPPPEAETAPAPPPANPPPEPVQPGPAPNP